MLHDKPLRALTRRCRWIQKGRSQDGVGFPVGKIFAHKVLERRQADPRQTHDLFSAVNWKDRVEFLHGNDHRWPAICLFARDGPTRQTRVRSLNQDGAARIHRFLKDFLDLLELGGTDNRQGSSPTQTCPLEIGRRFSGFFAAVQEVFLPDDPSKSFYKRLLFGGEWGKLATRRGGATFRVVVMVVVSATRQRVSLWELLDPCFFFWCSKGGASRGETNGQ